MQKVLHPASSRGFANHGWLKSYHTFSFAGYYDPERVHFGALRVLNDDCVAAGMGFGTHPHDNMEIISIPLEGALEHRDSMNNVAVIRKGDIQVMSAGTGIRHSEKNHHQDREVKFLQIWVFPDKRNVQPRYGQIRLNSDDRKNRLQQIVSPDAESGDTWIHQQAWFHLTLLDKDISLPYHMHKEGNGVYLFILSGSLDVAGERLYTRDGMGIWDTPSFQFSALEQDTEVLLMEVPMSLGS